MKKIKIIIYTLTFLIFFLLILLKIYSNIHDIIKKSEKIQYPPGIDEEIVHNIMDSDKKILIIDCRYEKFYYKSRIRKSIYFPYYSFDENIKKFLENYKKTLLLLLIAIRNFAILVKWLLRSF